MSSFRMNAKPASGSENKSIIDPANSSLITNEIDSSTIDYLVTQCETLLKNNLSKYDICIKYQEKLRLQLIKASEDYKCLKAWLDTANENCFKMISNDGHLTQIYESLLKNNILKDFVEHGVAREKLNLEFLSAMMQVKDLKKNFSSVDGDMASVKSDYEELQYREVLMQITSTEESHEYSEFERNLRLKSVSVLHECERLSTSLKEACEEIGNLKSKHDDLIRCYSVLLQNTSVKEFLSCAKLQEKLPLESPEILDIEQRRREQIEKKTNSLLDDYSKAEKFATNNQSNQISAVKVHSTNSSSNSAIEFFPPSISEKSFSELKVTESCEKIAFFNLRLNEYQEKLIAEQRRREQIEKEYSSLDEFSDKLCHLLLKYQRLMLNGNRTGKFTKNNDSIQNSSLKRNSVPCNANVPEELPSFSVLKICAPEMKEENNEELGLDKDELHLDARSNLASFDSNSVNEFSSDLVSKMSAPEVYEENDEAMDSHENGFHFLISSFEKDNYLPVKEKQENFGISLDYHLKSHFDSYDSSEKFDLVSSNLATYAADNLVQNYANRIEKLDSIVKNPVSSSSSKADLCQSPISTSMNRKCKQTANRLFYCKICDKFFTSEKTNFKQKCPTCDVRNTSVSQKKKSTINRPTSPLIKSNSVVANSSVTDFLCDICNRYLANKINLRRHQRLVHKIYGRKEFKSLNAYKCSTCNRCFRHPTHVKIHARKMHNKILLDSYKQPYKSSVCGKDAKGRGSQKLPKRKYRRKDKSCHLLLENQLLTLPKETVEELTTSSRSIQKSSVNINSIPSDTKVVKEFSSHSIPENNASESKEENSEEMGLDEDEFSLQISSSEEDDFMPVNEKKEKLSISPFRHAKSDFDNYSSFVEKFDSTAFSQSTAHVAGNYVEDSNRIKKLDSTVKNELSSSSDRAKLRSSTTNIKNFTEQSHQQIEIRWFYCPTCPKVFALKLKKNETTLKCPTCSSRVYTFDSSKSTTMSKIRNISPKQAVENSSKLHAATGSSNWAELRSSTIQKPLSATKLSYDSKLHRSPVVSSSTNISNSTEQSHQQTENDWFYCPKCQKPFASKKNEPILKCPSCSILDHTVDPMETKSTIDETSSRIEKNNPAVENSSKLNTATNLRCNICDRYFTRKDSLHNHKLSIHEGHDDFKCPICGKIFTRKHDMYRHSLIHSSLRPYSCSFCHKSFNQDKSRNKHIREAHKVDTKTLGQNRLENLIARNIVEEHVQNIRNDHKPLKKILQNVEKIHKPLKKNLRNVQKSRKVLKKNLRTVQNNHNTLMKKLRHIRNINKRHYCCAHCGQRFNQKQNMFHHICMQHFSGTLEHFKCKICKHAFPTKQLVLTHRQAYHYHVKNQNKCSKCNACFKNLSIKVRHEKYFHQNND